MEECDSPVLCTSPTLGTSPSLDYSAPAVYAPIITHKQPSHRWSLSVGTTFVAMLDGKDCGLELFVKCLTAVHNAATQIEDPAPLPVDRKRKPAL